ncbi:MAG: hypothetical protein AAGA35_01555 [Patescibacteria group bacterium]
MKRTVYIIAFIFLGLIVSTLVHAALEMPILWLVSSDYERYANSLLWQHWELMHHTVAVGLWVMGALVGYKLGKRYWHILYVEKRYGEKKW